MTNPNITNHVAAQLISEHLSSGLPHPGNPGTDQPPTMVMLPGFKTTGMPPQMKDTVSATTLLVAEAIVSLLETNGHLPT